MGKRRQNKQRTLGGNIEKAILAEKLSRGRTWINEELKAVIEMWSYTTAACGHSPKVLKVFSEFTVALGFRLAVYQ